MITDDQVDDIDDEDKDFDDDCDGDFDDDCDGDFDDDDLVAIIVTGSKFKSSQCSSVAHEFRAAYRHHH